MNQFFETDEELSSCEDESDSDLSSNKEHNHLLPVRGGASEEGERNIQVFSLPESVK